MSEASDWARVFLMALDLVVGLAISLWFFSWIMRTVGQQMGQFSNPVLSRHAATPKLLLLRPFCSHRLVIRGRDPHGRLYTACARCAKDVNAGKERWEWR